MKRNLPIIKSPVLLGEVQSRRFIVKRALAGLIMIGVIFSITVYAKDCKHCEGKLFGTKTLPQSLLAVLSKVNKTLDSTKSTTSLDREYWALRNAYQELYDKTVNRIESISKNHYKKIKIKTLEVTKTKKHPSKLSPSEISKIKASVLKLRPRTPEEDSVVSKSLAKLEKLRKDIIDKEVELLKSTPKSSDAWKKIVSEAWSSDYFHNKLENINLYNKSKMLYSTYTGSNPKKSFFNVNIPTYTKKQKSLSKHIKGLEQTVQKEHLARAKSTLGRILVGVGNLKGTRLPSDYNTDTNREIGRKYLKEAAKEGDVHAQYVFAVAGFSKDPEESVRYITLSARKSGKNIDQLKDDLKEYKDTSIYQEYQKFNFFWDS